MEVVCAVRPMERVCFVFDDWGGGDECPCCFLFCFLGMDLDLTFFNAGVVHVWVAVVCFSLFLVLISFSPCLECCFPSLFFSCFLRGWALGG